MKKKSWKREISFGLLVFWMVAAAHVFFGIDAKDVPAYTNLLTGITPFTVIPALVAFGFHDWLHKDQSKTD